MADLDPTDPSTWPVGLEGGKQAGAMLADEWRQMQERFFDQRLKPAVDRFAAQYGHAHAARMLLAWAAWERKVAGEQAEELAAEQKKAALRVGRFRLPGQRPGSG